MTLPKKLAEFNPVSPRIGVTPSISDPKRSLALLILLWLAEDKPSEIHLSPNNLQVDGDAVQTVVENYSRAIGAKQTAGAIDYASFSLFSSQIEPLDVALSLVWHIGTARRSDSGNRAGERTSGDTGNVRNPRTIAFTTNIDLLDILISTNESAFGEVLLAWVSGELTAHPEEERQLVKMLSIFSDSTFCKTEAGPHGFVYTLAGVYDVLADSPEEEVTLNTATDAKGPIRIVKSAIQDGLNPWLTPATARSAKSVKLAKGVNCASLQKYSKRSSETVRTTQVDTTQLFAKSKSIQPSIVGSLFRTEILSPEFTNDFARRYITSLLAKPFVILTGNSGTGKTRISTRFAKYLEVRDENDEANWLLVPVGADWTDNTKVLGFYNPLANDGSGSYEKTGILRLLERANAHPDIPYFLILDEMNLSHVERYFSDFLSHMETAGEDNPIVLDGYENVEEDGSVSSSLNYPGNLFVVGTVNIDETTYMFSPKVLDRANVIEFKPNEGDVLDWFAKSADAEPEIVSAASGTAEAFLLLAKDIQGETDHIGFDAAEKLKDEFGKLYAVLEPYGFEFAYRTVREVRKYANAAHELATRDEADDGEFDLTGVLDEQVVQKVLPKIHGNKREIGGLLEGLEGFCDENLGGKDDDAKPTSLSGKKVEQMKARLGAVQYASFI